jgi:hypothetical protein
MVSFGRRLPVFFAMASAVSPSVADHQLGQLLKTGLRAHMQIGFGVPAPHIAHGKGWSQLGLGYKNLRHLPIHGLHVWMFKQSNRSQKK